MLLSSQPFGYGIDWEVQKSCLDSLRLFEVTLLAVHQLSSPAYVMSVFLGSSLAIFSSSPVWFYIGTEKTELSGGDQHKRVVQLGVSYMC